MTAIVLPDIDRSTVEDLRKKVPNLTEVELPSLPSIQDVGKTADQAIDRLLGRKRAPVWPWIAAGVGLMAVIGVIAAYFAWFRRPTWESPSGTTSVVPTTEPGPTIGTSAGSASTVDDAVPGRKSRSSGTGLTAAETSLGSSSYPAEEA